MNATETAERFYRAEAPVNAEMRIRTIGEIALVEIVAAAPEGAGGEAPATCYVFARGSFEQGRFHALLADPHHPHYDPVSLENEVSITLSADGLRVEGHADYCALHSGFDAHYMPIEPAQVTMFAGCAHGLHPCWADQP